MTVFQLIPTRRFSVFDPVDKKTDQYRDKSSSTLYKIVNGNAVEAEAEISSGPDAAENTVAERKEAEYGGVNVPCMRLRELTKENASRFVALMEKHGFVVLKDACTVRSSYLKLMRLLKAFFDGDSKWKEECKGGVYFNERGIPMWHTGYERCGEVREAFRIPASLAPSRAQPPWPCPVLRDAWLAMLRLLQLVCHRALTLALGPTMYCGPPSAARTGKSRGRTVSTDEGECEGQRVARVKTGPTIDTCKATERVTPAATELRAEDLSQSDDAGEAADDFSVSYALHYPNKCADPTLQEQDLTVGEHVDPSLFVVEPCCGLEGLEIRDHASGRWLPVEAVCAGLEEAGGNDAGDSGDAEGRELILFGGKALERVSGGRIKGAPHRVRRSDRGQRYCFIYEQKYAEFFPPPALD